MKRLTGFIRWYDYSGDNGIITDFEGKEWYFNSHSFSNTFFRTHDVDKIPQRQKTEYEKENGITHRVSRTRIIKTKYWGGLFRQAGTSPDPVCKKLKSYDFVTFEQASGIDQRWAVKIVLDRSRHARVQVWESLLVGVLDTIFDLRQKPMTRWNEYYEKRLTRLLEEWPK